MKEITTQLTRRIKMTKMIKKLWNEEDGVTAIEYGLIAALIAVAIVGAVYLVGQTLKGTFETIDTKMKNPSGS